MAEGDILKGVQIDDMLVEVDDNGLITVDGKALDLEGRGTNNVEKLSNWAALYDGLLTPEVWGSEVITNGARDVKLYFQGGAKAVKFKITWGDGEEDTVENTKEAEHTYADDGTVDDTITVKLIAIDSDGNQSGEKEYTLTYKDYETKAMPTAGIKRNINESQKVEITPADGGDAIKFRINIIEGEIESDVTEVTAGESIILTGKDVTEDVKFKYELRGVDSDGNETDMLLVCGYTYVVEEESTFLEDYDTVLVIRDAETDDTEVVIQEEDQPVFRKWKMLTINASDDFAATVNLRDVVADSNSSAKSITKVVSHAMGYHVAVLLDDNTLMLCGKNGSGQLGLGDVTDRSALTDSGLTGVKDVFVGALCTFVQMTDDSWKCTGYNLTGGLGLGDKNNRRTWTDCTVPTDTVAIVCGSEHSYALTSNNELFAVGYNKFGQLATGDTTDLLDWSSSAVATDVDKVYAGQHHGMIIKTDGSVQGIGTNKFGELGDDNTSDVNTSWVDSNITDVDSLSLGWCNSYAVKTDGSLQVVGKNDRGQLGNDSTDTVTSWEQTIDADVSSAGAGAFNGYVVKTNNKMYMCGDSEFGQVGGNTNLHTWAEANFDEISSVQGTRGAVIIFATGKVSTMGRGEYGTTGVGSWDNISKITEMWLQKMLYKEYEVEDVVSTRKIEVVITAGTADEVRLQLYTGQ